MSENIEAVVRERYGATALSSRSSKQAGVRAVAEAFGYSPEELTSIPAEANMGLSCGNPTAIANLREGEVVVDLGSGGGLDVFLAAAKVGATGRVIGIDMTPEMIELAERNAAKGVGDGQPYANVEFHLAKIDDMPLPDSSVDCVISNCVINLAPNKQSVFHEIARVLKPGGRLAVSDIALKQPLPDIIAKDLMAYVGCVAGALLINDYHAGLQAAGFAHVEIVDSGADLNVYSEVEGQTGCCTPATPSSMAPNADESASPLSLAASSCCAPAIVSIGGASLNDTASECCAPSSQLKGDAESDLAELLRRYNVNDYAASVKVYAIKERA
ncbi:MAG: arsenite methyltransferase [Pyrinomonadaceae bacterium]|nr:arsenite methyltransferase [Pyrinomonadaceae bacterium]